MTPDPGEAFEERYLRERFPEAPPREHPLYGLWWRFRERPGATEWYRRRTSSLEFIEPYLPPPHGRVLEIGCGTGWLSALMARGGARPVGFDIEPEHVRLAKARARALGTGAEFVIADAGRLPFKPGAFDQAVALDFIEHFPGDSGPWLREAHRILRPGGRLYMNAPNRLWLFSGHSRLGGQLAALARRRRGIQPGRDLEYYYALFTYGQLRRLGGEGGFAGWTISLPDWRRHAGLRRLLLRALTALGLLRLAAPSFNVVARKAEP